MYECTHEKMHEKYTTKKIKNCGKAQWEKS